MKRIIENIKRKGLAKYTIYKLDNPYFPLWKKMLYLFMKLLMLLLVFTHMLQFLQKKYIGENSGKFFKLFMILQNPMG